MIECFGLPQNSIDIVRDRTPSPMAMLPTAAILSAVSFTESRNELLFTTVASWRMQLHQSKAPWIQLFVAAQPV